MSSAVLLAEPEEATRSFLERHLAQDGFEVVGVPDGEALELIERLCPDLVLIGDPEGLELCRRLRERDREVPVILLGAQESDPGRSRARLRPRLRRLPRPAVPLRRAGRADPSGVAPSRAAGIRAHGRRRDRDRPTDEARDRGRAARPPADEGVRAPAEARERPTARLHEGGAAPRRVGLPLDTAERAPWTRTRPGCAAASAATTCETSGASATACSATEHVVPGSLRSNRMEFRSCNHRLGNRRCRP